MSNSQPPSPTVSSGSDVQFIEQVLDLSASANIDAIPSSLGAVVSPPAVPNLQDVSMSDDESRMAIDFQAPGPSRTEPLMPPAQLPDDVVTLRAMTGSFDSTMRDSPSAFGSTSTGSAGNGRIIWTPVGTSAPDAGEFCGPTSQSTPSPTYSAMFQQEVLEQVRSPSPPPPPRVVRSPSPPPPSVQPPRVIAIPRRYNRNQGNQPAQRGFMPRQILLNRQMHYGTRLAEIAYTVANLWRVATTPEAIAGLSRPDLVARRDHIVGMATEVRNMRQNIGRVFTPAETATMVRLEMMALQFHEFAQTHGTGHPIARFLPSEIHFDNPTMFSIWDAPPPAHDPASLRLNAAGQRFHRNRHL